MSWAGRRLPDGSTSILAGGPLSFLCQPDGEVIGRVDYSPTVYYSWSFRNSQGNVVTFGSTKYQAVKLYVTVFLGKDAF